MAEGSIKRRELPGGRVRWDAMLDLGPDPLTGERRRRKQTFTTKKEATAARAAWKVEADTGTAVGRSSKTVREYMTYWLEDIARHRVRPSTYDSYSRLVTHRILPTLGATPLQQLRPEAIQALYGHLLAEGRADGRGASLSTRSVAYTHTVLRMALKDAMRLGLVSRNVADLAKPPRQTRKQVAAWDAPTLRRFLSVAESDGYNPLWLLAAHTGMRQGELLALRWCDTDLERGVVRVVQTLPTVRDGVIFGPPKTASGRRTISLDAACVAALKAHKSTQNTRRLALGVSWQDYDLVFTSEVGTSIDHNNVYHRFITLSCQAEVPRIPFHGLRHSHATVLMAAGVNPKVVSERLGHSGIAITLQTYSHVLPSMQQEAADVFARALS